MALRRWKQDSELTADEFLARRRDPAKQFETPEYIEARSDALINAGLEDEITDSPLDPNAMSTDQHLDRIRERRNS